jgi:diguanylate cyclase (GGDEF)-like protein
MNPSHTLLLRQLAKLGLEATTAPDAASWQMFLKKVDETYKEEDQSRYLLERSVAISSDEMQQLYQNLRDYSEELSVEKAKLERTNLELAHLVNYDPLTTLPNRALFKHRLEETLQKNKTTALLFIDLDGFKLINDSLGHAAGDLLLKEVAQRLKGCVRKSDTVARLAGDEFTIILEGLGPDYTLVLAEKVLIAIGRPYVLHGHEFFISASMGIAHAPHHASESDTLIKLADTAMYYAKSLGKNQYHVFSEDMNRSVAERMKLVQALRRGLEHKEFFLHYQPRIQLHSGQVISVEALSRWQHPEQGFIPPAVFIPLAEDTGIIHNLGDMVLDEACRQAMNWHEQGYSLRVAVNVSVKQLQQEDFVEKTLKILADTGLPPHLLELEITESAAMNNVESNIAKLSCLKEHGIYISIDDFGAAYSSLNYLKRLPVHSLKIDKSFIQDLSSDSGTNPANAAIVRSIVALGKNMDLQLVAEGVETAEQLGFLNEICCDEAQGYYFSKPVLPEDLLSYLEARAARL